MTECYAGIPDEVLDSTWLDSDLARLSRNVVSWEELAPFWGLTEAEEEEIKRDNHSYAAQKLAALRRWKAKCSKTATYRQLVRLFTRMGKLELVEKVREIVLNPEEVSTGRTGNVLSYYREFLEMSYNQLPQPAVLFNQWPVMSSYCALPLSRRPSNKAMRRGPLHASCSPCFLPFIVKPQHENKENELEEQEVHLPQLLSSTGSSLVIKGLPGSGKTTLMWHTSQQWAKRELLQHFSLFLSIPLRSTRVQHATCLADFIPHPDQEQRKAIAQAISATSGKGVCFWFDGWDEMPQEVQRDSFVASFIRRDSPGSSLPRCTTVVTTRPEASSLAIKSSEEIWMSLNGLTGNKVNEIITKSVEGTDHDPSELIASLESNTSLQAFCSTVPINVAILISLFFLFQSGLPNTQTELFKCLVLNLLLHNLQFRWKLGITSLKNFAELPGLPAESFKSICEIAFNGVINTKSVFLKSDVPSFQKQHSLALSTFGLMEISPRIEWYGVEEELTFLHTTLQEFLAAVHLTTLSRKKQVCFVKEIVRSKSCYQKLVLQFYVGLVDLNDSEVFNSILEGCCIALHPHLLDSWVSSNPAQLLLFVNCIFEGQAGHLCQEVTQNHHFLNEFKSNEFDICLRFTCQGFNTADFSHLGYFIGWFCQKNTCELIFDCCLITPQQFKVFINQVKQVWNNELHKPSLSLLYSYIPRPKQSTKFRCEQICSICQLIRDTNLVSTLNIMLFFQSFGLPAFSHYYAAMKNIIEAFARNSSCDDLVLRYHISLLFPVSVSAILTTEMYSEYYAVLLLAFCRHIKYVSIPGFFQFHYSYPLFACALRYNSNIQFIDFSENCGMCKQAIAYIAQALGHNETIEMVAFGDSISTNYLATFLGHYLLQQTSKSSLRRVYVGEEVFLTERETELIRMINFARLQSRYPVSVIRCIEADFDGGNGWTPSHYVAYTGFDTHVIGLDGSDNESSEEKDSEDGGSNSEKRGSEKRGSEEGGNERRKS